MDSKGLNIMAVSAPHWVKKSINESISLNSRTPFSLQNALRLAGDRGIKGEGYLGQSNWNSKAGIRDSSFLMEYFNEEKSIFEKYIREKRPNIIFIGSMTLSFPGAIALAKIAKDILGENVFVIIGGKHINETFFDSGSEIINTGASPLKLMQEGKIDKIFDLVCGGESEELIVQILEQAGKCLSENQPFTQIYNELGEIQKNAKGKWRIGFLEGGEIKSTKSLGTPIDYNEMPVPAEIFGIRGNFKVFDTKLTAHAFSDTSPGCVFDCFFCSERNSINGKLQDRQHSADRLFRQFKAIKKTAQGENSTDSVSVFVEDSTLLNSARNPEQLKKLASLMKAENFNIKFGAQFTVDQVSDKGIQEALLELKEVGLDYIFTGMETEDEDIAKKMSKNLQKENDSWVSRNEKVVSFLHESGIKYGIAVLFGLGESPQTRIEQLKQIKRWQEKYGLPSVVSLNLATIHPLQNKDEKEDFTEWGDEENSQYIAMFQKLFGEASFRYRVDRENFPSLADLQEIESIYRSLELHQEVRREITNGIKIK